MIAPENPELSRLLERGESLCGEHRKVWPECAPLHAEPGDPPEGQQSNLSSKRPPPAGQHARTHVYAVFANPFLVCDHCGEVVHSWHDNQQCGLGCGLAAINRPCGHAAGVTSVCPSWGPVDGCQCLAQFGHVPHAEAP